MGFFYFFSGKDIQNLVRFLYTGKTTLNEKEFEVFQQLVYEFQITTDENTAIILEEIARDCIDQESEVFSTMYRKCDVNNLIYLFKLFTETRRQSNKGPHFRRTIRNITS